MLKRGCFTLQDTMVWIEALIPFDKGELLSTIHRVGMVERTVSACLHILYLLLTELYFLTLTSLPPPSLCLAIGIH